jgi:hypothetical protein
VQNKRATLAVDGVAVVPKAIEAQYFAIECQEPLTLVVLLLKRHLHEAQMRHIPCVHVLTALGRNETQQHDPDN